MKGSLIVIVFFCVGCIMGVFNKFQFDTHTVSMYILYALMLQVGISIGSNKSLKAIISHLHSIGYHYRHIVVFCLGKHFAKSMECIRLYGSRKRIRLLFAVFHPDHSVQGTDHRNTVGYRAGYHCPAD